MSKIKSKKVLFFLFITLVLLIVTSTSIYILKDKSKIQTVTCLNEQENEYILGGEAVGIKLLATGVLVMGVERENIDIQIGDIILKVNGNKIETNSELEEYAYLGEDLALEIQRDDEILTRTITPLKDSSGEYKLGLWVKDSSAGVGTITFYEKNTLKFAALGHAITETSNQTILQISTGGITQTQIYDIDKGISKVAGQLKGTITNDTVGQICTNTQNGIFGYIEDDSIITDEDTIQIAAKEEINTGEAYIYVTLDDNVKKKYTIEIEKIYLNSTDNKNISIKITDEELLQKTGGIVQGMSGAPIVQNGKLIGAITHVLLDDPTRGYGAFIENMIDDMCDI